jgi:hypothetical protein
MTQVADSGAGRAGGEAARDRPADATRMRPYGTIMTFR